MLKQFEEKDIGRRFAVTTRGRNVVGIREVRELKEEALLC